MIFSADTSIIWKFVVVTIKSVELQAEIPAKFGKNNWETVTPPAYTMTTPLSKATVQ